MSDSLPPPVELSNLMTGFVISQAINVAARLRIADHLSDGAKSVTQLAELSHSHEPSLYRLLRLLSSSNVFHLHENGTVSNSATSELLRTDHPQSLSFLCQLLGGPDHWGAHGNLIKAVQTGQPAFDQTFNMPIFKYYEQNADAAYVFDRAMTSASNLSIPAVLEAYDFSGAATIADIGGGHGHVLNAILSKANTTARGVLFDLPHVVSTALFEASGVNDRVTVVSGSFFDSIPVEADIYVMKYILHDWNDEKSVEIINNLAKSAKPGAKLLLLESVIDPESPGAKFGLRMDVNMLAVTTGKERTSEEYAHLLEPTGFRLERTITTHSPLSIFEFVRTNCN